MPVSTNCEDWFLTQAQLEERGRKILPELPRYQKDSKVTPIIGASDYYAKLHSLLAGMAADAADGDYLFLAGPAVDGDFKLKTGDAESSVESLLSKIAEKADVRVLLSGHVGKKGVNNPGKLNASKKLTHVYRDARLPKLAGIQNQRTLVIYRKKDNKLVAFVGGPDFIAPDALIEPPKKGPRKLHEGELHTVAVQIEGPAALDVDLNFRQRWNNLKPASRVKQKEYKADVIPQGIPTGTVKAGGHNVQMLRTFGFQSGLYNFAPRGEYTAMKAVKEATKRAQKVIYIEDQLFVSIAMARLLGLQLADKTRTDLRIIVVVPKIPDRNQPTFGYWQSAALNLLRSTADQGSDASTKPSSRLAVYHLQDPATKKEICCHSALMIVDDVWASTGSMRLSRRSLTLDSELSVAVVDGEVKDGACVFARDLRLALWKRHLGPGADASKLVDPKSGFDEWARLEGQSTCRAVAHRPTKAFYDQGEYDRSAALWDTTLDPVDDGPFKLEDEDLDSVQVPDLIRQNRELGKRFQAAMEAKVFEVDDSTDRNQVYELAKVGSYLFPETQTKKEHLPPYNVCLTAETVRLYNALLDAAAEHRKDDPGKSLLPFKLISLMRKPGKNRGNHGRLQNTGVVDALGRPVEGVGSAADISRFNFKAINLQDLKSEELEMAAWRPKAYVEDLAKKLQELEDFLTKLKASDQKKYENLSTKVTAYLKIHQENGKPKEKDGQIEVTIVKELTAEQLATLLKGDDGNGKNSKLWETIAAVDAVLRSLPVGEYGLGLPRLGGIDLYRIALYPKEDLTAFISVLPHPSAKARKTGRQWAQQSPVGTYSGDLAHVRNDDDIKAKDMIIEALKANTKPKISLMFPDGDNHLHITVYDKDFTP